MVFPCEYIWNQLDIARLTASEEAILVEEFLPDTEHHIISFCLVAMVRSYLLSEDGIPIERPQHMYLRCALQAHCLNIQRVRIDYDYLSTGMYIVASPILFNSGTG